MRAEPALTPVELAAQTAADTIPNVPTAWLPVDFVRSPNNPVYRFDEGGQVVDRIMPTVMRVDDKIANPMGHWYLWVWRHGRDPRTADNGGRMILLSADSLEGPWTDHGFVTPENSSPDGWGPYSWTGGDVIWSAKYQRFFSVPHAYRNATNTTYPTPGLDSFLMESLDGVTWSLSSVTQPVLPAGPEWFDKKETGYGRLIQLPPTSTASEPWAWLYRCGRPDPSAPSNGEYYAFCLATADDIHGPWTKASWNPVFDPYAGSQAAPKPGGLVGLTALTYYHGMYQILWQDGLLGFTSLAHSDNLLGWNDLVALGVPDHYPTGRHHSTPVFVGAGPNELALVTGSLVWDDRVRTWTYVYLSYDAGQIAALNAKTHTSTGAVNVNVARSLSGGDPPLPPGQR
jgi:hypothetical protein